MKTFIIIIILSQLLSIGNCFAQSDTVSANNAYRNCVKEFYSLLLRKHVKMGEVAKVYARAGIDNEAEQIISDSLNVSYNINLFFKVKASLSNTSESYIMMEIKKSFSKDLTQGYNMFELMNFIDDAKIYNQGDEMIDYLEIDFPNKKSVWFSLDTDNPSHILGLYLSNQDLLESTLFHNPPEKLLFPGTINDPDGYVNIREKPSATSNILGKLLKDDYFFYVPETTSNWWLVKRRGDQSILGYVHKSRIMNYLYFPPKLKELVQSESN